MPSEQLGQISGYTSKILNSSGVILTRDPGIS